MNKNGSEHTNMNKNGSEHTLARMEANTHQGSSQKKKEGGWLGGHQEWGGAGYTPKKFLMGSCNKAHFFPIKY